MEVSTIMASQAQPSQAMNGTVAADETGTPLSSSLQSDRFSSLLGLCSGKGENAQGGADSSANAGALKVVGLPVQKPTELAYQQNMGSGFLTDERQIGLTNPKIPDTESEPEITALPEHEGERIQDTDVNLTQMDLLTAQQAATVNPFITAKFAEAKQEVSAMQLSEGYEAAIPSMGGKTLSGFVADGQSAGLSGQIGQELSLQQQGGKQGVTVRDQTAALPLQAGSATETEPAAMQSDGPGRAVKDSGSPGKGDNLLSGVSIIIREPATPRRDSFSVGKSLDSQGLQAGGSIPVKVAAPGSEGLSREPHVTLEQAEGGANGTAAADAPMAAEVRMGAKDAVNAYLVSGRESSSDRGNHSSATAEIPSDKAENQKQKLLNPSVISAQNGTAISPNPGLNINDAGQAGQRVDIEFVKEAKQLIKETEVGLPDKGNQDKTAGLDSTAPFVPGETRINGETRSTTPANDGKLSFSEHIHRQVREKLESGDYASNKGDITLKLHPEELGELKINLRMEDQRLKVEIVTENRAVKEALMQNLDTLKETLSRQNITMDRFNVSTDLREGFQQGSRDGSRMMQGDGGVNTPLGGTVAAEEPQLPKYHYGWENDDSIVSLVL